VLVSEGRRGPEMIQDFGNVGRREFWWEWGWSWNLVGWWGGSVVECEVGGVLEWGGFVVW